MSNFGDSVWVFRNWLSETGRHPRDILVEIKEATLAAGTVEIPTQFRNGNIIGVWATGIGNATVNEGQAFTSDLVVTSGAITLSGPTASTAKVAVLILGKTDV